MHTKINWCFSFVSYEKNYIPENLFFKSSSLCIFRRTKTTLKWWQFWSDLTDFLSFTVFEIFMLDKLLGTPCIKLMLFRSLCVVQLNLYCYCFCMIKLGNRIVFELDESKGQFLNLLIFALYADWPTCHLIERPPCVWLAFVCLYGNMHILISIFKACLLCNTGSVC